jgi:lipoprotein NlpD
MGLTAPVPVPNYYVVQPGDTLYALSLRFDRDYREIARINHLADDDRIRVGQKLLLTPVPMPKVKPRPRAKPVAGVPAPLPAGVSIPSAVPDSQQFAAAPLPPSPDFPDAQNLPPPAAAHAGRRHKTTAQTARAAATTSGTDSTVALVTVPIPEPAEGSARPPSKASAPARSVAVALVPPVAASSGTRVHKAAEATTQVTENKAETDVPKGAVEDLSKTRNGTKNAAAGKPAMTGVSQKAPLVGTAGSVTNRTNDVDTDFVWAWPIKGQIIGHYGSGGLGNKGLDIAGRRGDAVLAAADGVVVYVGTGLVGYGKLIIIRHNNNYLSAYAHNDRFYVNEGDGVKVGEKIADVGSSGADRDELHFEIRRQGKPVDPLQYLPPR